MTAAQVAEMIADGKSRWSSTGTDAAAEQHTPDPGGQFYSGADAELYPGHPANPIAARTFGELE